MNSIFRILVFLFIGTFCFGQAPLRKPLHGKIINDSIAVENGFVFNLNSKTTTFINAKGFFDIKAMPKDTLLIRSLALKPQKVVLKDVDFDDKLFVIKAQLFNNQLKEVIVNKKIKPKIAGSQAIVDTPFFDDAQSSPINRTMPYYGIENGIDFVRIAKQVKGLFKKKNSDKQAIEPSEIFMDKIQNDFKSEFFKDTLKLKPEELNLFLIYCDADDKSKRVLKSDDRFKIMDFLITKNQEFKKLLDSNKVSKQR